MVVMQQQRGGLISGYVSMLFIRVATSVDKLYDSKIKSAHLMVVSLLLSAPAAWGLASCRPQFATSFILFMVLFSRLSTSLEFVQKTQTSISTLFGSLTSQLKEIAIYTALAVYAIQHVPDLSLWMIVLLAGTSFLSEFVVTLSDKELQLAKIKIGNKLSEHMPLTHEMRMFILAVALLLGALEPVTRGLIALNLLVVALHFIQTAQALSVATAEAHKKPEHSPAKSKAKK